MTSKRFGTLFYRSRLPVVLLLWPSSALAVQSHGGTEGLVAHQLAHGLFILGIGYLFYKIQRARFTGAGWFEFKAFLWLLVAWNLVTFAGHWMREYVEPGKFFRVDGHVVGMTIAGAWDVLFYLTRLDHLLLVPAFLLLLLALRQWRRQP
jgi:hypothetical protein